MGGNNMPYADNQGVHIHYQVEGKGPPLVLQHGFTSNLERWRQFGYVDALKQNYQLILLDARGHGASDKPHDPAAFAWDVRADDVVAVLDHIGLGQAHFWGYSMGGVYAFNLAKYAPDRVQSLIIGGACPNAMSSEPFRNVDGTDPDAFITALEVLVGERFTPEVRELMLVNDFQALSAAAGDRASMEDILPAMTMPCLVYVGEDDIRYQPAKECVKQIPRATFVALPGCNHIQAFMNRELVMPHVTRFLQTVTKSVKMADLI